MIRRHEQAARGIAHHAVADADAPAGVLLEAGDHAQRRGLAAARRPEQRDELAALDRQIDVVDGDDFAEMAAHVFDENGGHRFLRPRLTAC